MRALLGPLLGFPLVLLLLCGASGPTAGPLVVSRAQDRDMPGVEQCDTMENFYTALQMKYRVSRIWLLSSRKQYFRPRDQDLNIDTTVCQVVSPELLKSGTVTCQGCRWFNMDMEPFSEDPGHIDAKVPVYDCFAGSHMDDDDAHAWLRRDALRQQEKYAALCVPPQDVMAGAMSDKAMNGAMDNTAGLGGGSAALDFAGADPMQAAPGFPTNLV